MKNKTDDNYTPSCCYCVHAKQLVEMQTYLCKKQGAVNYNYHCRSYKFDPLKPSPKLRAILPQFDASDFKLEEDEVEIKEIND